MNSVMRMVGAMSGSSLDGLDLALCRFTRHGERWLLEVERCATAPYDPEWRARLLRSMNGPALELARLDRDMGIMIGMRVKEFLNGQAIDGIASHGHTTFHKPDEGLTVQIGNGAHIAAVTSITTICDFRTKDIAMGGQGAPLVPLGERNLFADHRAFINLGGIANISIHGDRVLGYDIGPCNQPLNELAAKAGLEYDEHGALAATGQVDPILLDRLNALEFYRLPPPRSLGREWYDEHMKLLITRSQIPLADRMRTVVEHIASMIAGEIGRHRSEEVLVTGGGAHNTFLIGRIRALVKARITIPELFIVDFKEAIIFAYLGLLRLQGRPNILGSVTGGPIDSIGGAVYLPN